MIRVSCPRCAASLGLDDLPAGAAVRCPDCGATFFVQVPGPAPAPVGPNEAMIYVRPKGSAQAAKPAPPRAPTVERSPAPESEPKEERDRGKPWSPKVYEALKTPTRKPYRRFDLTWTFAAAIIASLIAYFYNLVLWLDPNAVMRPNLCWFPILVFFGTFAAGVFATTIWAILDDG